MALSFLRETHPELFGQLVVADDGLATKSNRKVRWRCGEGHEWEATVASRSGGAGCPYCSGRRRIVGVNDLATTHPELVGELVDGSLATQLAAKGTKKVAWRCGEGHEWMASPLSRTQGNGCPVCSNRLVVPGVNDLTTTHPELAAQAVDQDAVRHVSYGSTRRLSWRCEAGHEWEAVVANRAIQGQGCPRCLDERRARAHAAGVRRSRKRSRTGSDGESGKAAEVSARRQPVASLSEFAPDLAGELVNAEDARFSARSPKRVAWRCGLGHVWHARIADRVGGNGCPYCSNRKVLPGFNDLATTHPDIARLVVDVSRASAVSAGSHAKLEWRGDCGHTWTAAVKDVVRGRRCPVCAGKEAVPGVNDLATTHPDLSAQLVDASLATSLTAGSDKVVEWRGECGHVWQASVKVRARAGHGCPYCANRRVLPGFNDLATTHPALCGELADRSLSSMLVAGSNRVVEWRCGKGHAWRSPIYNRAYLGTGCPVCEAGRHSSDAEDELYGFVSGIVGDGVEVLRNRRDILDTGGELDIAIPSMRIAVEFNGCYWHSDAAGKGGRYHADKLAACRRAGYSLITVWEDTWRDRRRQVERMLASRLGVSSEQRVFARDTEFCVLDGHAANVFLDENHIQGAIRSTLHFGLVRGGDVVAVMSVRSPGMSGRMKRADGRWDIVRYATSCHVVGGFSKLLSHAERYLRDSGETVTEWVSFSDNEVSEGGLYRKCGFILESELRPDYKYVGNATGNRRVGKESFQKSKFKVRAGLLYEEGLTERQLAELNGLYRCWDCGKRRWVRRVGE